VQVQGDAHLAVPKPLAGDLGMDAAREEMRCVGVAQVVEADARQPRFGYLPNPFMRETVRLDGLTIGLGHDESVVRYADAETKKALGLLDPVRPQFGGHRSPTSLPCGSGQTSAVCSGRLPWFARQTALPKSADAVGRRASIEELRPLLAVARRRRPG